MATAGENTFARSDLDPITVRILSRFRRRRGLLLLLRSVGVGLLVFVSLTLTLATLDYVLFFSDGVRWSISVGIYVATAAAMWLSGIRSFGHRDELEIARHVESVAPNLRENLVSAVELSDPGAANGSPYFRKLLQSRVARRVAKVDVGNLLPFGLVRRWLLSGFGIASFCVALMFIPSAQFGRRFARAALPGFAIERASKTKVTIIEPSPPSGYVAERDAVGVVVRVKGADPDDVMLHWRSADGSAGESLMTPRLDASDYLPGQTTGPASGINEALGADESISVDSERLGGRFAANLSVGSVPIQYRITAGDAITLWHELTPLPRPRAVRFEKRYRLPAYALLDDRVADEEHGDLKALQGTTAEVTVTFDQPVENPVIRFGVRGARSEMEAVDDSGTKFLARVSIKTSGQYQVDATSVRSGLNNPFSPTNMITPVLDTPPIIRWSSETKPSQLVSSLDVIELAAVAADDLPLERVVQEVQVNEERFKSYPLEIEVPDRKLSLAWSWDMMNRLGTSSNTKQLSAGDLVKTRLVAIDRRGTRTESELIEFLIAGEGFDADRHEFLQSFSVQVSNVIRWADQSAALAKSLEEMKKSEQFETLSEIDTNWKSLQKDSVSLIKSLSETLTVTQNTASASMTELVGRSILDIETRLDGQLKRMQWLSKHKEDQWGREWKKNLSDTGRDAEQTAYQCERLSEFARARFSLAFSASLYSDATMLRDGVNKLVENMPKQRVPRYLTLIAGQLADVDRLIEQYEPVLSQQTIQHLSSDHWIRWSDRWRIQLEKLIEDQPSRDQILAVVRSMRDELQQKPQHVIDSSTHNAALRWGRDLRKEVYYLSDLTRRVFDAGESWKKAKAADARDSNADEAVLSGLNVRWSELVWQTELSRLVVRAAGQEKLNRAQSKVDLQYAADQHLFLRAIKNVTADGYQPYKDESPDRVLASIGSAIGILQAASDVAAVRNDWMSIREGERQGDASPLRKIYHPVWFKLQDTRIELAVRYLRQSNLDWKQFLEPIDATRYNDDHTQANSKIDSRQWRMDPFLSAGKHLESLARDLQTGLDALSEKREESREVLRQYVLKLSEQAREAAEAAKEAEQETDKRDGATEKDAEELQPKQQEAAQKATETIGALIDQANTTDIMNDEQREVARDADAAAELIADALKATKEAIKQAEMSTATQQRDEALESVEQKLDELSQRLEQTAEHFGKIEAGEDASQSREELREAERQLQSANDLDERYERADEMAETAKQDPRELLRELEEELKQNEPMQEALSDISAEMVDDVAKNLRQAASDEDVLQRRLESEDDAFAEQKRQKQLMLDEFTQRAKTIRDQTLGAAAKTADSAKAPEARDKTNELRQQLNESITQAEQASRGNPTLSEIQAATQQLQQALNSAAKQTNEVAEELGASADEDVHGDENQRKNAANQLRNNENQLRNAELRALDQQRKKWSSTASEAGRRVRNAEQQARQAESAINREQGKLKKDPNNDWLKREIEKQQDRRDEALRTAEQSRQTNQLATERRKLADQRADAINKSKVELLKKPNPAAELGEKQASNAAKRMENLAQELKQLADQSDIAQDLRATSESAGNVSNQQRSVETDVQTAVEDLARASRHEARLENVEAAQQLAQASEQTETNAVQPAKKAGEDLQKAIDASDQSAQAAQSLQEASRQIDEQAEAIESLLGQSTNPSDEMSQSTSQSTSQSSQPQQSQPSASADATQSPSGPTGESPSGQPSGQQPGGEQPGGQPSPQQKAQTLDELDRSLAAQANGPDSDSQQSSSQPSQGNQGQPSDQPPGQPGGESQPNGEGKPGTGQPPKNAVEASPTLAEMLEAQMQQAARERMKSLQQATQAGEQPGDPSSDSTSPNPVSESGQGEIPDGPDDIDLLRGMLEDGDWGDLRRRGVDDAAQGRPVRIPPGYSREIKAYFKALSKRAAEAK